MESVIHSFNYSLDFLVEQVADVRDEEMAVQPSGVSNHPLWTIGHITFALQMIGGVIGVPHPPRDQFPGLFDPESSPVADRLAYESKQRLIARLRETQADITAAVELLSEVHLEKPFPDAAYLDVFPTVRHALTQVLIGHTAFHIGQLSVWRKAMGLPTMKRSYE